MLLLGVTGLGSFIWMASTGWQDAHGVVVGIIFITLSVLQSVYGIFWYRAVKRDAGLKAGDAAGEAVNAVPDKELAELRRSPINGNKPGARESAAPLLQNRESATAADVGDVNIQVKPPAVAELNESQA